MISVLGAALNSAAFMPHALQSALNQNANLEVIVHGRRVE